MSVITKIYVDGACNKNTGDEAWGSVTDFYGNDLLEDKQEFMTDMETKIEKLPVGTRRIIISKFNDVKTQQNNGAELLAMLVGLRMAMKDSNIKVIHTDSQLVYEWWSTGHISPAKKKTMDPRKKAFIEECGKLRIIFEKNGGKLVKIPGDTNPSDLGWH